MLGSLGEGYGGSLAKLVPAQQELCSTKYEVECCVGRTTVTHTLYHAVHSSGALRPEFSDHPS